MIAKSQLTKSKSASISREKFIQNGGLILNGVRINPDIADIYNNVRDQYQSNTEMLESLLIEHYNRFIL